MKRFQKTALLALFGAGLLFSGCTLFETGEPDTGFSSVPDNIRLFFTAPGINPETARDTGIADKLANLILSARKKVDICIYELSEPKIYEALITVYKKGIPVRFVGDIANTDYSGYQALMAANIPMTLGHYVSGNDYIMHNKFMVIDSEWVTMGSANYTGSGTVMNHENVLIFRSTNMASYYTREFENIYNNGTFGLDKVPFANFTQNKFTINAGKSDETKVEVYFTPYINGHPGYENTNDRILECISNAQHSICVAMFAFTEPNIAQAIIYMATNRGVEVYLALDKGWHTASEWSMHQVFIDAGLNVRYDGNENYFPDNPYHGAKIHDKIMIIDAGYPSSLVFSGSFNFSSAAADDGNDENCIIISNMQIANLYREEFARIYNIGTSPTRDVGGDRAPFQAVMINEINWAGHRPYDATTYTDKFVELKNMTTEPINISGWQLVGTPKSSYRIISTILPQGSIIEPGGCYVIYQSLLNSAFTATPAYTEDYFLYLRHKTSQPNLYLVLKDTHQNIIDVAGSSTIAISNFGGSDIYPTYKSMYRVNTDGTLPASWATTSTAGTYVKDANKANTLMTPGE